MDKLKNIIESIQKWCKDNDISIFYGAVDKNFGTEVSWKKETDDDWSKYLSIFKKTDTKILIINEIKNETEVNDPTIIEYKQMLNNDDRIEYEEALKVIKNTKGHVAYFNLTFNYNNVCYNYSQLSDWAEEFMIIQEAFSTEDEYNDYDEENE